jgi:hypothetical protein
MININSVFSNFDGTYPNFVGKNVGGPGLTDGTEWIAAYIDNWGWGWTQALLTYQSITPNGVTESSSASQILDALNKFFPIGCICEWNRNDDPSTDGFRFLFLNGQGITRANYSDLDAAVYVGDANNATAPAYYRADNSDGTSRSTTGAFLILPESRGYTTRGLDTAASVDPDGATRGLGDNQADAMQRITGTLNLLSGTTTPLNSEADVNGVFSIGVSQPSGSAGRASGTAQADRNALDFDSNDSTSPNTAKTNDVETRMSNRSTRFVIRY